MVVEGSKYWLIYFWNVKLFPPSVRFISPISLFFYVSSSVLLLFFELTSIFWSLNVPHWRQPTVRSPSRRSRRFIGESLKYGDPRETDFLSLFLLKSPTLS